MSDNKFYKRLEREQAKKRERENKKLQLRDERMSLMRQVRSGEITLDQAKALNPNIK